MIRAFTFAAALWALSSTAFCQAQNTQDQKVSVTALTDRLFLLQAGTGGNIVVCVVGDGVVMVDAQYGPLAGKIPEALKQITEKPVRFLINTHYHADHTDGNILFRPGTVIIANDNVRKRLEAGGVGGDFGSFRFEYKPSPKEALPTLTFDKELTLHFNGEEIRITHLANSHTDGDSIVYFPAFNVVHLGDEFVTYGFPDIEIASGGKCQGMIDALEWVIASLPKDVKVIPGHGPVSNLDDVRRFVTMLKETQAAVKHGIKQGKTLSQLQTEKVLEPWKSWAGFFTLDVFTEMLYNDLTGKRSW